MTEASIFAAINTQLATLPGIDENHVAWLGKSYIPQSDTPFISTSMPVLRVRTLTSGTAGVDEWVGTFQVSCYWPIGAGIDDVLAQKDAVRVLFPKGLTLPTADGWWVKFFAPDPKPLLQGGAWVVGIVQCPWFLHEVTA